MSRSENGRGGCCSCLICSLLKLALSVGSLVFVWWLIFHPRLPRASVTEIELWNFNLTDNSTALRFNVTVRIALRNPNRRVGLYYDSLDAALTYHGASLMSVPLWPLYQHHKSTTEVPAAFDGLSPPVDGSVAASYESEKKMKTYKFNVKLGVRLRMKLWFIKIGRFNPKFDCSVGVPVPTDEGMSVSFGMWVCDR